MVASCVITLQLENLVVFTKNDNNARRLVSTSIFVCSALSVLLGLLLFYGHDFSVISSLKLPRKFFLILILHLIFYGLHEFLTSWALRNTKFKLIAISQIIFHFCLIGCQIILSFLWSGTALELAVGFVVAYALSSAFLYANNTEVFNHKEKFLFLLIFFGEEIKKNTGYILNAIFPAIFDQIRAFIPILILTKFFSSEMAGVFFLTLKILNFPIMLFSTAFSKSIFQEYSKNFNDKKYLYIITKRYVIMLLIFGFIIYSPLFFLGKNFIVSVIGMKWEKITLVMPILCLGVCSEFISLPLLTIFPAIRKQHILAIWKVLFLVTSLTGLYYASKFQKESTLLWAYSFINSVFYTIGIIVNIRTEKILRKQQNLHAKTY